MTAIQERERLDVVLVGRMLPDNENLGLGYLLAALHGAGLRAEALALNAWTDMDGISRRVRETDPLLVGLSIPDGGSAFLPLGLGELLRRRGFRGHVTAGGPFATLARSWLLERYAWLDSVVRLAGEIPLPRLVESLRRGCADLDAVPGLTTRGGDGAPAPVMDEAPLGLFPEHGELPQILGHPAAHIAASRGCPGRCAYCGPASLQRLERSEGFRGGWSGDRLACAGVGGTRRRPLESICDEMAELWRERGVRYFYFVDEHVLPRGEDDALAYLGAWKAGLARRGVGNLGIGCMLRADILTPAVARAFAGTGLVRCFAGVEFASNEELRRFSRGGDVETSLGAMREMETLGVATICNVMLVHPYSTVETLARGIGFLERFGSLPFEATQMQVYHGTRLHRQMAGEGRLTGNPLRYGTTFEDGAVRRFSQIFSRLRGEAFGDYSLAFGLHDARLAVGLAGRLVPSAPTGDLARRCLQASTRLGRLKCAALREALSMAVEGGGFLEGNGLVERTAANAARIDAEIGRICDVLMGRLGRKTKLFAPMRAAAAALLAFSVAGAPMTGCRHVLTETPSAADAHKAGPGEEDVPDAVTGGPEELPGVAPDAPVEPETVPEAVAADEPAEPGLPAAQPPAQKPCPPAKEMAASKKLKKIVRKADPCLSVYLVFDKGPDVLTVQESGNLSTYNTQACTPDPDRTEAIRKAILAGMTEEELACLPGYAYIDGKDGVQRTKLMNTVFKACPSAQGSGYWYSLTIEVDGKGKVKDIVPRKDADMVPQEAIDCIKKALGGLVFPCLANYSICPEYVIIE
jgi:anaerobic magnesium-protoporphyrin IX monomethyl ester cyclase